MSKTATQLASELGVLLVRRQQQREKPVEKLYEQYDALNEKLAELRPLVHDLERDRRALIRQVIEKENGWYEGALVEDENGKQYRLYSYFLLGSLRDKQREYVLYGYPIRVNGEVSKQCRRIRGPIKVLDQ